MRVDAVISFCTCIIANSGIEYNDPKQSVELKMPDDKYNDIPPSQTGFAKAAVDRYACMKANRFVDDQSASSALFVISWEQARGVKTEYSRFCFLSSVMW